MDVSIINYFIDSLNIIYLLKYLILLIHDRTLQLEIVVNTY